ncbi:MAG: VWA domain-containing protein [Acidobacteria bacterium]|nr:VWA domain-containing protein [Acidobacteriota bacterium]MCW5947923.1 VWA domain-containing protein [Pyrinomonadaceae bacterium]
MFKRRTRLAALIAVIASSAFMSAYVADGSDAAAFAPRPTPTATPPVIEDDEPIKIDTDVVNVLFTAQDRSRRLLTTLKKEDIRLLEDGKPQEIVEFTRQVDLPLSLAILVDVSVSQQRTLPEQKEAAISFLESVVRPAKDEVAVLSFTGETTLEQDLTNNLTRLRRAVDRIKFVPPSGYIGGGVVTNGGSVPGTPPISGRNQAVAGSTAIWDAIWVTSNEVLRPAPEKTRRAIILLSDGVNTSGQKKLDEAVQAAVRTEAIIYAVGIGDSFFQGVDRSALNKLTERTGGRAFFPRDERDLRDAFRQIEEEMRSQYLVAYEPTNQNRDGSYRSISIQLVDPNLARENVKLTHRQGYFAKGGGRK